MDTLFPGTSTESLLATAAARLTPNYRPAPVIFTHGEGVYLFDRDGKRYLDMVAGIAVNCLGYGHPRLSAVIAEQAQALMHVSNLYLNEPIIAFVEKLASLSGFTRLFAANSGAEANEGALKLARRYQTVVKANPAKSGFLAFDHSFHGRTFGALSVTGNPGYHKGFEPLIPGVHFAQFGDLASVDAALEAAQGTIGAIIVEPIQCEGGIHLPPAGFLEGLRERATAQDIVLIFDEVQTGVGRTGEWFCWQKLGVRPDVLTTAKGIAGGVPLGVVMSDLPFAEALQPGTHASTFGGNALAARAGLEVLRILEDDKLVENAAAMGDLLAQGLSAFMERFSFVKAQRGMGLIQGLELESAELTSRAIELARERGMLVTSAQGKTLRFLPPLVTTEHHIAEALAITESVLAELNTNA